MIENEMQQALIALQCDVQITQILLSELIAQSPQPQELLNRLHASIDAMTLNCPSDIGMEQVVELRARAQQTTLILSKVVQAANEARR